MMKKMKKRGLFEKLSGGVKLDDDFDVFEEDAEQEERTMSLSNKGKQVHDRRPVLERMAPAGGEEETASGELGIDMFQTGGEIVIRAFVAGVRSDALDISITRDLVTIAGAREPQGDIGSDDYFHHDLFWGAFSRRVMLPQEIDVESSSASAKDGLLTIILPKLDKARQTKLKVKAG